MPSYSFYIYNTTYLDFNASTNTFDFQSDFKPSDGIYKVEVSDDDSFMDDTGDANQFGTVTDLQGNVIASGLISSPTFAELNNGANYLDRIEIDGVRVGYYPETELVPNTSYPVSFSSTGGMSHGYFEANNLPCFGPGALVRTDRGIVDIADLAVGDQVLTRDHGPQPIRWIATAEVSARELEANPSLRPVSLALDGEPSGYPPLYLSSNHRVLISGAETELLFGAPEVLVAAGHLTARHGVSDAPHINPLAYTHLLCADHEIIEVNGLWVETLLTGPMALSGLPGILRRRAARIGGDMIAARPCLTRAEASLLRTTQSTQLAA
jgi:hypothetical protein